MDINQKLTEELEVKRWQVDAAVKLIDEGNTIPFISRYRKEATGSLNDEQLRKLHERLVYLRNLEEKKEQVLSSIEEQGKLTEELKSQILEAGTLVVVEDLYRPYRPGRTNRRGAYRPAMPRYVLSPTGSASCRYSSTGRASSRRAARRERLRRRPLCLSTHR